MTKRFLAVLIGLGLGAGLVLTGCGDPTPATGTSTGMAAPELKGNSPSAQPLKLSDYKGKVVLVDFWATWCVPCRLTLPAHKELFRKYAGQPFTILGVSGDESAAELHKFLEDEQIPWPNILDSSRAISREWQVSNVPTLFLIDKKGVIRHRWEGVPQNKADFKSWTQKVDREVAKLLAE
jgi:peroxiredoxin